MNILVLAKGYPPETGGVETYSKQVALAYVRAGHYVTVVTAHPGPKGTEIRGGVTVINLGQKGGQLGVFRRMLLCLWSLRTQSFDFVHATTWRVALTGLVMRRKLAMVLTIHGREVFVVPKPLKPIMLRVLSHAQHLPTVSQPILDKFESDLGFKLEKAFANWNGISFENEPPRTELQTETTQIFCMCRLVKRKNVDGAIRAVAELVKKRRNLKFNIAGSGPEAEALSELIAELNMTGNIRLLGRVPNEDVADWYRNSQIFLHPQIAARGGQDMEGFGITIADAMAFGCVPIAGGSGGPLDFIRQAETGYVVDGTSISAITDVLDFLLTEPNHLAIISQAAYEFAHEKLTWDSHTERITRLFN